MKNMKHQRQRSMLLRFDFSNRNVASNRNEREKKNRLLSLDVAREWIQRDSSTKNWRV